MSEDMITYKILLLGDSMVGKSTFIIRFCEGKFEDETFISTIGLDTKTKYILHKNHKIQLKIWDTAGEERFHSITKNTFKGANGILLMYDISNYDTFKHIKNWISDIKNNANVEFDKIAIIILGNKSDLSDELRKVDKDDIEKFENENEGLKIMEVSVKNNYNVNESMMALIDRMLELGVWKRKKSTNEDDEEEGQKINNNKNKKKKGNCCDDGGKKK